MARNTVLSGAVRIGEFTVSFQRTLRIPDDDKTYPLPPGLGRFPVLNVEEHAEKLPKKVVAQGGVLIPMYQREALWLGFETPPWRPRAVQVAVGGFNAVSGAAWDEELHDAPQNYVVCPDQPWLDGINAGNGIIRQFVAMPLGLGYTVEAALSGAESTGGIQIAVYEPKPGRFPDRPPQDNRCHGPPSGPMADAVTVQEMGVGAGGRMKQKIYPDPHGLDVWDQGSVQRLFVHLINSLQYQEIACQEPPTTPVDAALYTRHGLPWFDLYDEDRGAVAAPTRLTTVRTIADRDAQRGIGKTNTAGVEPPPSQVHKLRGDRSDEFAADAGKKREDVHSEVNDALDRRKQGNAASSKKEESQ